MRYLAIALLLACGNDTALQAPDAGSPPPPDSSDGFTKLIATDWTLDTNTEKYLCVRLTVSEDTYVKSIRPIAPPGTHHGVLMLGPKTTDDGTTECNSSLTEPAIYASGVGTQQLDFPAGIGLHIHAGDQLFLNLHLFNATDGSLSGTSGIEILPAQPGDIVNEAGSVLVGKTAGLTVVPGTSDQTGTCTTPAGTTMFAVAPHMHLLGTHLKATYEGATVIDTDYTFDDQHFRAIDPMVTTVANGKYVVTCSYDNPGNTTVNFGESTTDEMCFAMTYVYPPPTQTTCTH